MASPEECARGAAVLARTLTAHWCLLTADEQRIALLGAYVLGSDLAAEAFTVGEYALGDARDYRRVAVHWACSVGVCLEFDRRRWKLVTDDPRIARFGAGFHDEWQRRTLGS